MSLKWDQNLDLDKGTFNVKLWNHNWLLKAFRKAELQTLTQTELQLSNVSVFEISLVINKKWNSIWSRYLNPLRLSVCGYNKLYSFFNACLYFKFSNIHRDVFNTSKLLVDILKSINQNNISCKVKGKSSSMIFLNFFNDKYRLGKR